MRRLLKLTATTILFAMGGACADDEFARRTPTMDPGGAIEIPAEQPDTRSKPAGTGGASSEGPPDFNLGFQATNATATNASVGTTTSDATSTSGAGAGAVAPPGAGGDGAGSPLARPRPGEQLLPRFGAPGTGGADAQAGAGPSAPGDASSATGPQGSCGDGRCALALGENSATCPVDCGVGGPLCGNRICDNDAGETTWTCPVDCAFAMLECGDGFCNPQGESAQTCPEDCALLPPQ